jgi:homoserine O-acetyltransferase/O-succinyltransferase
LSTLPADARKYAALPTPFVLRRGGVLHGAQLAYETWGELSSTADNVILIYTGMSPGAHAASSAADPCPGWWEDMLGAGKPIDTQRWFVICVNSLGSCKGSTGPASIMPGSENRSYRMDFPDLCVEDIASANLALLAHLGIAQVAVAIGCSMGGMGVLAHAALAPGHAKHAVLVSSAAYAEPFAIGIRSLQRQIVLADPNFKDGKYASATEVGGMGLARKLGVISYRSADEWRVRFSRQRVRGARQTAFAPEFEVERYLQGHADRWTGSFDPCSYIYLSRAMDWFDLAEHGVEHGVEHGNEASIESAYAKLKFQRALVLGVASDILFPLAQQQELARALVRAGTQVEFHAMPSLQGHDAFLVDMENFGPAMAHFLNSL